MKTLKISLDFLAGPLWKDELIDGETRTGIPVIDNDAALQALGMINFVVATAKFAQRAIARH